MARRLGIVRCTTCGTRSPGWAGLRVLVLALLGLAMVGVPGEGWARGRASRPAKLRYTLTVTYTGRWHFAVVLGAENLVQNEKVSTWKASSVTPFTLQRTGTPARPRYRFSTKVAGTIEHRGSGDTRWLMETSAGTFGPCWFHEFDSNTEGNREVRGVFSASDSPKEVLRFSGYDLRRPLPRVMTTTPAYTCPVTVGGKTVDLPHARKVERCSSGCPVMPQPWSQAVAAKDVKFGRKFTLKRIDDPITSPELLSEIEHKYPVTIASLGTLPAGSVERASHEYRYVLTFKPLPGSQ